jgi:betaine-aldehyde dehydrogenase
MKTFDRLYIDGRWAVPHGSGFIEADDASTEAVVVRTPQGDGEDVAAAAAAARRAFDTWSATPVPERAALLRRIGVGLAERADEIARAIAVEVGMPLKLARRVQTDPPTHNWTSYADQLEAFVFEQQVGNSLVVREPIGVVACITPWNFPLNQITLKVAPALAAGCTVILKPSEVAPTVAFILAEVIDAAGAPPGVFNLVSGFGPVVGEALAAHPEVDMVSFTGSTRAGRRVGEVAAATVKRVALELGGKSASVILDDADLPAAVKGTVSNCFLNSGQACIAQTRMLVPRTRLDEARDLARQAAEAFTVGPALSEGAKLGPLVSAAQRDRVRSLIRQAIDEGAELVTGGDAPPVDKGWFVKPTVFVTDDPRSTIAQEEVFGPVLTIIPYGDEADAVRIANDTPYGLGGGVWGEDRHALAVARRIRTGQVDINGGAFNPKAPFGGFKQSGNGREGGVYGLEEFLEYKSLQLRVPKDRPAAAAAPAH